MYYTSKVQYTSMTWTDDTYMAKLFTCLYIEKYKLIYHLSICKTKILFWSQTDSMFLLPINSYNLIEKLLTKSPCWKICRFSFVYPRLKLCIANKVIAFTRRWPQSQLRFYVSCTFVTSYLVNSSTAFLLYVFLWMRYHSNKYRTLPLVKWCLLTS